MGSIDNPFNPLSLAIGTDATFVARAIDTDRKELTEVLRSAAAHRGAAFVEIFQNCNIYNDNAFATVRDDKTNRIYLKHGEPVRFGEDGERGVRLRKDVGPSRSSRGEEALVWDAHHPEPSIAFAMSRLTLGSVGAAPFGVFRDVERPVYDEQMAAQARAGPRGEGRRRPRGARRHGRHVVDRRAAGRPLRAVTRASRDPLARDPRRPTLLKAPLRRCRRNEFTDAAPPVRLGKAGSRRRRGRGRVMKIATAAPMSAATAPRTKAVSNLSTDGTGVPESCAVSRAAPTWPPITPPTARQMVRSSRSRRRSPRAAPSAR